MGKIRRAYNISVENLKGRSHSGKNWRRWEDNARMDPREIRLEGADWIQLAQSRDKWRAVVNTVMNLRVSKKAENLTS
jgi:hypothetical protein